jgi:single-strand DNA-binding protein
MTQITVAGNLAADPELKFTASGKAYASFTVMSSKSVKKEDGTWENSDVTAWSIKCWNRLAENVAECLRKGVGVVVLGYASSESWEDAKTGQKRSKVVITANSVGIDLKRHTVSAIHNASKQTASADLPWGEPSWAKATDTAESFPF